jgi:hypothetical protein
MSEADGLRITTGGGGNVTLPRVPGAPPVALPILCRLAAEAEAEGVGLNIAADRADAAGDYAAGKALKAAADAANERFLALDDLAATYPATDLPGALYGVALACWAADDVVTNEMDTSAVRERAVRIVRLLRPVLPLLRDAAGPEAADMDLSRLLPTGTPGARPEAVQ